MHLMFSGFLLGLSIIMAIGPQNALIIKQGIKREGIVPILAVCMISDVLLIFGGTAGVGMLITQAPIALVILKWLGVAYLAWFGFTCFRDAFSNSNALVVEEQEPVSTAVAVGANNASHAASGNDELSPQPTGSTKVRTPIATKNPKATSASWVKPVMLALAFTWLNPAAWIDVLVLLGGLANQHGDPGRWYFASGALMASMLWFPSLGFGAQRFSSVLAKPTAWKIINFAIGCVMVTMCIRLILQ